jgi:hypothetical protein
MRRKCEKQNPAEIFTHARCPKRRKAKGVASISISINFLQSPRGSVSAHSHNVTVDGNGQWDRRNAQHVNGNQGKNLCARKAKQMLALRPISSMIFHKRL